MTSGGSVVNGAGGNKYAALEGGVYISGGEGTVLNSGFVGSAKRQLFGDLYGENGVYHEASVFLNAGGTVTNGSISDTTAHIQDGVRVSGGTGTVRNYGTIVSITQKAGTYYRSSHFVGYGVDLTGGGSLVNGSAKDSTALIRGGTTGVAAAGGATTVTNFGTIVAEHNGVAVSFGSASDVLIEEASGVLTGRVIGGGGKLALGAGAGAGTIGGIDGSITGFAAIVVNAGADWRFVGPNTIVSGTSLSNRSTIIDDGTITNAGVVSLGALLQLSTNAELANAEGGSVFLAGNVSVTTATGATGTSFVNAGLLQKRNGPGTSIVSAPLANSGTVEVAKGTLDLAGVVTGGGALNADAQTTLEFGAAVATGGMASFAGANAVLRLDDAANFKASIAGFAASETIDLRSIGFGAGTTIAYMGSATAGTLTVTHGTESAQIALLGQFVAANFHAASDGHGGTDITFVAVPANAQPLLAASH